MPESFEVLAESFIKQVNDSQIEPSTTVESLVTYKIGGTPYTTRLDLVATITTNFPAGSPLAAFAIFQHKQAIIDNINSVIRHLHLSLPKNAEFVSATLEILHP